MLHIKSESDMSSLAPSSPSRPLYFVQSPSRDSQSFSVQATPSFRSPMESPAHRFSGDFRSHSGEKGGLKRNDKGWPECDVIVEEGKYDGDHSFTRWFQAVLALFTFLLLLTLLCLIIWGAARPFKTQISLQSLAVNNLYIGEGSDSSGVITKMLTLNGSLRLSVYNPATFFGVHVSSDPVRLIYSDIVVANGQLKKYFQPRKSRRTAIVSLEALKVPLYGAGSGLEVSDVGSFEIPLRLEFEILSKGEVVGKLVTRKQRRRISCTLVMKSTITKPIRFKNDSCTYT